jgi:hypothetical protein
MKTALLCAALAGTLTAAANAADISWETATSISGTADVSLDGSLYGTWAPGDDYYGDFNTAPENYTVNGVAFATYGTPGANFAISGSGINMDRYNGFANPNTTDSIYNNLLQVAEFNWNAGSSDMTVSWEGMTPGNTYLVEAWLNDGRSGQTGTSLFTGGANTSGAVAIGNGVPGQFLTGTFVADGSGTQSFTMSPGIMLNLIQVRDITPAPEPSTIAMLAGGFGVLGWSIRRQCKRA